MRYDLEELRLFVAAADSGNLTRAAERCHLAPSSASHRLKRLEDALGAELFERHARGLRLTRAGELLLSHARELFARVEQIHADLAPFASGVRAQVSLHANTNATNSFLPDDLAGFLLEHPQLRVSLRERSSPDIVRAVAAGEAEIGVVAGDVADSALTLIPYRHDRLVLVLPPKHPLAGAGRLRFAEVADQAFISLNAGSAIHTFLMNVAADAGVRLDVRIQVLGFHAILRMVAAGVGLSMVPRSAVTAHPQASHVAIAELDEAWAMRDLRLCVRDPTRLSRHARALVEWLSRCGGNAPMED